MSIVVVRSEKVLVIQTVSTAAVNAKIDAHIADTTDVHGIADTSALETSTGSAAKVATGLATATGRAAALAIVFGA
jgi:hypothetical protein